MDIREVAGCSGLRLRKASRRATHLYDAHLAPAGLTIGQFGIIAQLYGAQVWLPGLGVGVLAERLGMDPTTLNRSLKPLESAGWIGSTPDPEDRRARLVALTPAGKAKLAEAAPMWQRAQQAFAGLVGEGSVLALNGLLEMSVHKLRTGD